MLSVTPKLTVVVVLPLKMAVGVVEALGRGGGSIITLTPKHPVRLLRFMLMVPTGRRAGGRGGAR